MSNTSSNKHEETHNSDTLADETGLGGDVHHPITEVPPTHHNEQELPKSRKWLPITIIVGFLAVFAIIGLAVGLTRESDVDKDEDMTAIRLSKGTWIPVGKAVVPELDLDALTQQDMTPFQFWNFDTDGEHLVVADTSAGDYTSQVRWYAFQEGEWMHQTTLPLGDAHPSTHPVVAVAANTLVVADANSVDLHPDLEDVIDTNNGLVSIYQLGEDATFNIKFQASAGDMWGTTVAMDKTATYLAVGTPLASELDTDLSHTAATGVVHVYNLKKLTLESVGRPLYGPHFLASLGGAGLALSGDGKVLAATAAGQVWIWQWNTAPEDWSQVSSLGPGVGNQVALNDNGTLLAHTTFNNKVVVYRYICQNPHNCGWDRIGVFAGSFVTLHGNNALMAIGTKEKLEKEDPQEEDEYKYTIQVYEFDGDEWHRMGSGIDGRSAEFMDDKHILVQQDTTGVIQTWQWAGVA